MKENHDWEHLLGTSILTLDDLKITPNLDIKNSLGNYFIIHGNWINTPEKINFFNSFSDQSLPHN